MGFKVEFNSIIRIDILDNLEIGKEYEFENDGSRIYFDDIPIWLVRKDWAAVAEVKVTKQKRKEGKIKASYKVLYLYSKEESELLSTIFKRMYGWK
ncbi:MAG: hypothetical protein UR68_C0010G0012 [Candidatus Roizmanbacteria bacterium GW2011_GWA2_35_19]|uniref:Uncharacterized protein n=2 Tax=Candidatus Roizmaniibacteriota TaxID=1752723 RepID=A0A0G0F0P5_9BACT|nr:MAG: hypothetical protein UR63_C0013G0012 [Candidatus Roizmanbacteria bacterium GW2011_GWC2_35_12]KKP72977.1 MAG: hypothetical protein UR68_C0010G0012 [Candidatus Roizmanbacteria bacterium GW2011_GWA2_35_19]